MRSLICSKCKLEKPLSKFFKRRGIARGYTYFCKECHKHRLREWRLKQGREVLLKKQRDYIYSTGKHRPAKENRQCSNWLGIWIAERVLSRFFDGIQKMPPNTRGFDFICTKGHKIDVKSGCRISYKNRRIDQWKFVIKHNKIADYFLCLAFDNRENLNPEHIWLIPGEVICDKTALTIYDNENGLSKWAAYERPIDKVSECCNLLRR